MIRNAEVSDIPRIVRLEKKVFTSGLGQSFLYDELTNNPFARYFVCLKDQAFVGYIGCRVTDDTAEMMNFAIEPDYQHQGYGRELLMYLLDFLKQIGVKTLVLDVRRTNRTAIGLYESMGFKRSHVRKFYYENEDAIVYIKEV